MNRPALFLSFFVLMSPLVAEAGEASLVFCSSSGHCEPRTSADIRHPVAGDVAFVWIWTANSSPRRIDARDLQSVLADLDRERDPARLTITPSAGIEEEVRHVIAAPLPMWREVPEGMLPRHRCAEAVTIPARHDELWRARVVSQTRTSLWTDVRPGAHFVPLLPAAPAAVTVSDADGQAVAKAQVTILRVRSGFDRSDIIARLEADKSGLVAIPNASGVDRVTLTVTHPRYAPETVAARIEELPATIVLDRGSDLEGFVRRRDGKRIVPVEGARVSVEAWIDGSSTLFAKEATTDAQGRFRIPSVPPGTAGVTISRKLFAVWRQNIDLDAAARIEVILEPEAMVILQVFDEAGDPIAGASASFESTVWQTSIRGEVHLTGLERDRDTNVVVRAMGFIPSQVVVRPAEEPEMRIVLGRGVMIRGVCVDEEGRAVDTGRATIASEQTDRTVELQPDGSFEVTVSPRTSVSLTITSTTGADLHRSIDTGDPGSKVDLGRLVVPSGYAVRGRVVDAEGAPASLARIWAVKPSVQGEMVSWMRRSIAQTNSGQDGVFDLRGLEPVTLTVRVDAPGFARHSFQIAPDASRTVEDVGEVILRRGGKVTVQAGGEGALTAELDLGRSNSPADLLTSPVSTGFARFMHVPAGQYRVRVRRERLIECEVAATVREDEETRVTCESSPVLVRGTVSIGGRRARGGSLVWAMNDDTQAHAIILNRFSPGGLKHQESYGGPLASTVVPVGESGSFTSQELRAGMWNVTYIGLAGTRASGVTMDVPARASFECVLNYHGGEIRGVVKDLAGSPRRGVVSDLRDGTRTRVGEDGRFSLSGIPYGTARVVAESGDLRSPVVEVEISEGGAPEIELSLFPLQRRVVTLRVQDSSGMPAPGAFIFVESSGRAPVILTTDAGGAASFRLAEDDQPRLRVAAVASGQWTFGDWMSINDQERDVIVRVGKVGILSIGGSSEGHFVRIVSLTGWDVSAMLRSIGVPIRLNEPSIAISGLPPGAYVVAMNALLRNVYVEANRVTEVDFSP